MDPGARAARLRPQGLSVGVLGSLEHGFVLTPTPSLLVHQFQAKPHRCSRRMASIIERIDLGGASNPMRVPISLTAATTRLH
jgi:hypothetical protein